MYRPWNWDGAGLCPSVHYGQLGGQFLRHVNVSSILSHCGFSLFYLHNDKKILLQNLQLMKFILIRGTLDFSCLSQTHQYASSPGEQASPHKRSLREWDNHFDQKICSKTSWDDFSNTLFSVVFWQVKEQKQMATLYFTKPQWFWNPLLKTKLHLDLDSCCGRNMGHFYFPGFSSHQESCHCKKRKYLYTSCPDFRTEKISEPYST